MKVRLYFCLILVTVLTGCGGQFSSDETTMSDIEGRTEICLEGVVYYKVYDVSGYAGFASLAPKVDKETLTFVRCEG